MRFCRTAPGRAVAALLTAAPMAFTFAQTPTRVQTVVDVPAGESIKLYDDVINLGPRAPHDGSDARPDTAVIDAPALQAVDRVDYRGGTENERSVRVLFYRRNLDDRLVAIRPGQIVVGANPACDPFRRHCGLMGRLTQPPADITCERDESRQCLEMIFTGVGLDRVIEKGVIKVRARAAIAAGDEQCFRDGWPDDRSEASVAEMARKEFGCATDSSGELPPGPNNTTAERLAGRSPARARLTPARATLERCRDGDWTMPLGMNGSDLDLFDGAVRATFRYLGMITLTETIRFGGGGVESAEIETAYCQQGRVDLAVNGALDRTTPLWVRSTGPQFRMIGWLPLVYSATARLDFTLAGRSQFGMSPFATLDTTDRFDVSYDARSGWRSRHTSEQPAFTLGPPDGTTASMDATATLSPALQVNLYGTGGPIVAGDIVGDARLALQDETVRAAGRLSGTLKVGLQSRLLDQPLWHVLTGAGCKLGDWGEDLDDCLDTAVPPDEQHASVLY